MHRFFGRIRWSLQAFEDDQIRTLEDQVEVDETYFGPTFKNHRHSDRQQLRKAGANEALRSFSNRFSFYQRQDGIVYVEPVAEVDKLPLQDIIRDKMSIETIRYSDTWQSYRGLKEDFADHQTVDHGQAEYARGRLASTGSKASGDMPKSACSAIMESAQKTFYTTSKKLNTVSTISG